MFTRVALLALIAAMLPGCAHFGPSSRPSQSQRCADLKSTCTTCNNNVEAYGGRLDEPCPSCSIYETDCKGK